MSQSEETTNEKNQFHKLLAALYCSRLSINHDRTLFLFTKFN